MKWVLRTSSIIVGTDKGSAVFGSFEECPPEVRRRMRETLPGPDTCTIMITNREALDAIRSQTIAKPQSEIRTAARAEPRGEGVSLPRWQVLAGALLGGVAAVTALLVWAMNSE